MKSVELDQAAFQEWLEARRDQPVGEPCNSALCPLARWLDAIYAGSWYVGPSTYHDAEWEVWQDLSDWAGSFVRKVDGRFGNCAVVTGEMALEVLLEAGE